MSKSEYVEITGTFLALSTKAIKLDCEGEEIWIARSCIYGPDETRLNDFTQGDEITIGDYILELSGNHP